MGTFPGGQTKCGAGRTPTGAGRTPTGAGRTPIGAKERSFSVAKLCSFSVSAPVGP